MRFLSSALALLVTGKVLHVGAFVPTARDRANFRLPNLHDTMDTKESEKLLRQEIAERNSIVENEAKYALADGERLDAVMGEGGIADCGNAQVCVEVCPKKIPLTESIAEIGRETTFQLLRNLFLK